MSFEIYHYSEVFSQNTVNSLPKALRVGNPRSSCLLLILRLLSGTVKVENITYNHNFRPKNNYFLESLELYGNAWPSRMPKLMGEHVEKNDLANYIEASRNKNVNFFKELLFELTNALYQKKKGSEIGCFTFIYRCVEKISYALPLIYVSRSEDFYGTYTNLKRLFSKDKDGKELSFFKNFIEKLFRDDPLSDSSVDIVFSGESESDRARYFRSAKKICAHSMIGSNTDAERMLSIPHPEVGNFIVTLRNRFFHLSHGHDKNIQSHEISDPDFFFSCFNDKFLYWLSSVILAVVSQNMSDFESNSTVLMSARQ